MKLIEKLKTFAAQLKAVKITRNDYRWFFIPTLQYSKFTVEVLDEATRVSQGNFRDVAVKGHFLCYTLNIYTQRTKI